MSSDSEALLRAAGCKVERVAGENFIETKALLDKMAEQGRGEVEYVGLNDDGSAAVRRFHERVQHPLLTDLSVNWDDLAVTDVYPASEEPIPGISGETICEAVRKAEACEVESRCRSSGPPISNDPRAP